MNKRRTGQEWLSLIEQCQSSSFTLKRPVGSWGAYTYLE